MKRTGRSGREQPGWLQPSYRDKKTTTRQDALLVKIFHEKERLQEMFLQTPSQFNKTFTCCNTIIPFRADIRLTVRHSHHLLCFLRLKQSASRASSALVETSHWANARLDLQHQGVFEIGEFFFLCACVFEASSRN